MEKLEDTIIPIMLYSEIFNYIPLEIIKFCNKKYYSSYLKWKLPSNKYDWYPIEVYGADFRECVHNMFNFILNNKLHNWFIEFQPECDKGYMYDSHPIIDKIEKGVYNDGHSGATFACCLRVMQDIFYNKNLKKWLKPLNKRGLEVKNLKS